MLHGSFDYGYLQRISISKTTKLLVKLIENREKKKAFKIWLLELQSNKDAPLNFNEYWQNSIKPHNPQESNKTAEEIIEDVESILAKFKGTQ